MHSRLPRLPEIFVLGRIPTDTPLVSLCKDGLDAWTRALMGAGVPSTFLPVMAEIARRLQIDGTPESLRNWASAYQGKLH